MQTIEQFGFHIDFNENKDNYENYLQIKAIIENAATKLINATKKYDYDDFFVFRMRLNTDNKYLLFIQDSKNVFVFSDNNGEITSGLNYQDIDFENLPFFENTLFNKMALFETSMEKHLKAPSAKRYSDFWEAKREEFLVENKPDKELQFAI